MRKSPCRNGMDRPVGRYLFTVQPRKNNRRMKCYSVCSSQKLDETQEPQPLYRAYEKRAAGREGEGGYQLGVNSETKIWNAKYKTFLNAVL